MRYRLPLPGIVSILHRTNAAQIFHLLRRQMVRKYREPLIVMSPKSLLRHKDAGSRLADLTEGGFLTVIGEVESAFGNKLTMGEVVTAL